MINIDVALDALRADARAWSAAAALLDGPATAAAELALTPAQLSVWAVEAGLDGAYQQAQQGIGGLLAQAQLVFAELSASLAAAADTYQQEDERQSAALTHLATSGPLEGEAW